MLDEEIFPIVHSDIEDVSLGDGDGAASADLIDPKRNDGAAAAHNVTVTSAADGGAVTLRSQILVLPDIRDLAIATFSSIALVMPMELMG